MEVATINVGSGRGKPTIPELADQPPIDRTTINSWEDPAFLQAVRATGRRKLIFCALWTEVCMAFSALEGPREGYDVYPVVDAMGGTSVEGHRAGARAGNSGGWEADHLGLARVRTAARLGTRRDGGGRRSDRAHRATATGIRR